MSFGSLLNHHADLYRQLPPTDPRTRGTLGEVIDLWEPVTSPAGNNCRPDQAWAGLTQDRGPGDQPTALRRWFLHKSFAVAERDVLDVTTGTDAPIKLRVLGVTACSTGRLLHHIEVNVEVWQGALTAPEAES